MRKKVGLIEQPILMPDLKIMIRLRNLWLELTIWRKLWAVRISLGTNLKVWINCQSSKEEEKVSEIDNRAPIKTNPPARKKLRK